MASTLPGIEQLLFTARPGGKGVNSTGTGFQIAACSAGLDAPVRGRLESICMHYGPVVHAYAPDPVQDKEKAWRSQTAVLDVVPENIVSLFPLIFSFDKLDQNRVTLTRVRYLGLTHDKRVGNFLAHVLVFSPEQLAAHGHNPLALSRTDLFRSKDIDGTVMESLPDLGKPPAPCTPEILAQERFRPHLAPILTALCAGRSSPPVLLGIADWKEGLNVAEALLNLLPPAMRSRLPFCTYEGEQTSSLTAEHRLVVRCPKDGQSLRLRPDEYRSRFAVFNFVENKFSHTGTGSESRPPVVTRYAGLAAAAVLENRLPALADCHDVIDLLGLERPDEWEPLIAPDFTLDWGNIATIVPKRLGQTRLQERQIAVIRRMADRVDAKRWPEAALALRLKLLEAQPAASVEALLQELKKLITQCGHSLDAHKLTAAIDGCVQQCLPAPEDQAEAFARLAESVLEPSHWEPLQQAFNKRVGLITRGAAPEPALAGAVAGGEIPRVPAPLLRRLVRVGARQMLCACLFQEVLPWDEARSPRIWDDWWAAVFCERRDLLGYLRETVAQRLNSSGYLWLARALLIPPTTGVEHNAGHADLFKAVLLALPLAPLGSEWDFVSQAPEGLAPEAESRRQILLLLGELGRRSREPGWSVAEFPKNDPRWEAVRRLPGIERHPVICGAMAALSACGIGTAAEAGALREMLAAVGVEAPADIAAAVDALACGDRVSLAIATAAFSRCITEVGGRDFRPIVRELLALESCDLATYELLAAHVEGAPAWSEFSVVWAAAVQAPEEDAPGTRDSLEVLRKAREKLLGAPTRPAALVFSGETVSELETLASDLKDRATHTDWTLRLTAESKEFLDLFGALRGQSRSVQDAYLARCLNVFAIPVISEPRDADGLLRILGKAGDASVERVVWSVDMISRRSDRLAMIQAAVALYRCASGETEDASVSWREILRAVLRQPWCDGAARALLAAHIDHRRELTRGKGPSAAELLPADGDTAVAGAAGADGRIFQRARAWLLGTKAKRGDAGVGERG